MEDMEKTQGHRAEVLWTLTSILGRGPDYLTNAGPGPGPHGLDHIFVLLDSLSSIDNCKIHHVFPIPLI